MKAAACALVFAGVSAAQMCSTLAPRRALEAASSRAGGVLRSEPVGRLQSGETRADFTAFAVSDPVHVGHELRGVRVELASPEYSGVVYIEGAEIAAVKARADWLARMARDYPNETAPFAIGGARDDPACPLAFTYQRIGSSVILRLRGLELIHDFELGGVAPSELVAILARAAKALKR